MNLSSSATTEPAVETAVIVHDANTGLDLQWTTISEFISANKAAIKRPGTLTRQLERAIDRCQVLSVDLGASRSVTVRRAPELSNTVEAFRAKLARIGTVAGMTLNEVFAMWCEYSHRSSGQSAILGEFVDWYTDRLGGDRENLRSAVA